MIVVSPDTLAPGSESDALVHVTDVFSTALHAAGISVTSLDGWVDGQSLLSYVDRTDFEGRREYLYSEWFKPLGATVETIEGEMVAVRDANYKLMIQDFPEEDVYEELLFEMTVSPHVDGLNLLDGALTEDEQAAYERLSAQLEVYRAME
jgi:arylsulfatase A-like enzyme